MGPLSASFSAQKTRLPLSPPRRVAVVGAGLAGLACARVLADRGLRVTVFDKGRSVGGRATSRREESGRVFDHGAQFFTARGEWLQAAVALWEKASVVARWSPRVADASGNVLRPSETWWVGTPSMGALAKCLANGLDVKLGCTVSTVARASEQWSISFWSAEGDAPLIHESDALVLALPASQSAELARSCSSVFSDTATFAQTPCWAVMLGLRGAPDFGADVFEDRASELAWAAREGSKPGRARFAGEDAWMLHASTLWSKAHLEDSPEAVCEAMVAAFAERHGAHAVAVAYAKAHRWRFARSPSCEPKLHVLVDRANDLVVCGDWLASARVESALESGRKAAEHLLGD